MGEISEKSGSVFFKFSPPKMESPLTWAAERRKLKFNTRKGPLEFERTYFRKF